jgi:hypothetical protein
MTEANQLEAQLSALTTLREIIQNGWRTLVR